MAMLDRYKKKGGFGQLLVLIETCGHPKQEKFLEMIKSENINWHAAISKKMLTMERILAWPEATLAEVFGQINELTVAVALVSLGEEIKTKMFKYMSHGQQRRILAIMETKKPNVAEAVTVYNKIIEEVRNLINARTLRADKFDPGALIEDNVDELINAGHFLGDVVALQDPDIPNNVKHVEFGDPSKHPAHAAPAGQGASEDLRVEVATLHRRATLLNNENIELKRKLKMLEEKLEQIRKIA